MADAPCGLIRPTKSGRDLLFGSKNHGCARALKPRKTDHKIAKSFQKTRSMLVLTHRVGQRGRDVRNVKLADPKK
jgi:hypothetical protein